MKKHRTNINHLTRILLFLGLWALAQRDTLSAQSPPGQVVSWGLSAHYPYVRPGTVFTNVACGADHNIGITREGTVVNWGSIFFDPPPGLSNVVAVAGSDANQCYALKANGTVVAWGQNKGLTNVPAGINGVRAIAPGSYHCLALRSNGTVVAWGDRSVGGGQVGQTNVPPGLASVIGIAAGSGHSVAVKSDGTVVAWGDNGYGQTNVPPGLSNVVRVAAGGANTLALKSDGTVVAWGNTNYDLTQVPPGLSQVVQVCCDGAYAIALRSNGTVAFWPQSAWEIGNHTTNLLAGLSDVVEISGGMGNGVARKRDGTFVAWGYNEYQRSVPPFFTDVVALPATTSSLVVDRFLTDQGRLITPTVVPWLHVGVPPPPDLTNIVAYAEGGAYYPPDPHALAVRNNGTVVAWGWNYYRQADVPAGLSNVVAVAAGGNFSVALKSDGQVTVWGADYTELGGGTTEITNVPPGLNDVQAISAGQDYILALKSNGTVVAWGDAVPPGQPLITDAVAITCDRYVGLALQSDGRLVAWGYNHYGQLDVPPDLINVVSVAASLGHCMALKNDGKVVMWGNLDPRLAAPAGLKNVVAISVAGNSYYAIVLDPQLSAIRRTGDDIVLRFRSFAGQLYQIQSSPDLSPDSWLPLPGGDVTGDGQDIEVTDTSVIPIQPARFYRLVELN